MEKEDVLAKEVRTRFIQSCARTLTRTPPSSTVGIVLSGGVDTAAVLVACEEARKENPALPKVTHAVTVLASETAPDREFAVQLGKEYQLRHVLVETTALELVTKEPTLNNTVRTLQSFDPMNVRNSLVIERALQEVAKIATEDNVQLWLTGDAADELLGGYSFTWKAEDPEWTERRNKMARRMTFAADALAKLHGLLVLSPFRDAEFVEWIMYNCPRSACIGERDLIAKLGDQPQRIVTGKTCLRDAFPESLSSKRRKDPIEVGSGSTVLSQSGFFSSILDDDKSSSLRTKAASLRISLSGSAEQTIYFDEFLKIFENLRGLDAPRIDQRTPGYCRGCFFQLYHIEGDFCRSKSP